MVQNGIDLKNLGIQRFSRLEILIKYKYVTCIAILIPTGAVFDTIIDIDYLMPCIHLYTGPILGRTSQSSNMKGLEIQSSPHVTSFSLFSLFDTMFTFKDPELVQTKSIEMNHWQTYRESSFSNVGWMRGMLVCTKTLFGR